MSFFLYTAAEIGAMESAHAKLRPKDALMLRAGAAVAALAVSVLKKKPVANILVLAGPGNNGGDAWVAAAALLKLGHRVTILEPGKRSHTDAVAQKMMAAYRKAKGATVTKFPVNAKFDLIIDGLFGIGLTRAPRGVFADAIAAANASADAHHTPMLAIDVPSGLLADTGGAPGATIRADFTLTFLGAKAGLYTADGVDHAGEIRVDTLGVDVSATQGELLTHAIVTPLIPQRRNNAHKGSFGSVGVIGGAAGMVGAAVLAARAALHMGPGKVYLGLAAKAAPTFDAINPEIMLQHADQLLADKSPVALTALAVGMGLGVDKSARHLLKAALALTLPTVVDADALTMLATNASIYAAFQAKSAGKPHRCWRFIFTPHPGEAARLLGASVDEIQSDRVGAAKAIAAKFNAVTVLKGAGTIIATPDARYWVNTSGNPGMASGGMGDALSGMIASFLAQGVNALDAARLAVYLHGAAADECLAHGMAPHGLTASEVIFEARTLLNAGFDCHHHG